MPHDTYTHGHSDAVWRAHSRRTAANSVAYLLPHLTSGQSLLDVGCGPGTITADLARLVAPGPVVGIDREPTVLDEAGQLAKSVDNLTFAIGDAYQLDSADASFDIVHAHQILHHLSDPVAAIREMARVARPGGLVALRETDYAGRAWYPQLPGLDRWHQLYDAVARLNQTEPNAGRHLLAWTQAAGLTDLTPSADVWCFASPDDRRWWGLSWAERTVTSDFARQVIDHCLADAAELEELAAAWRQWADDDAAWFAVLHGQVLARVQP